MVLVSNNHYRLGRAVGSGTRPRIDDGLLGVTVVGEPKGAARAAGGCSARCANGRRRRSRSTPTSRSPPASTARRCASTRRLNFVIRPGVLRVRIARQHPGASPSALVPEGLRAGVAELTRIALGRPQKPATPKPRTPQWI